jgi:radical SAM superfamily enzyme YgiQ (UPF0313 family)
MTEERLRDRLAGYPYNIPILYFLTSRGCPHQCSYCNNCRYAAMFGRNTIRLHSVDRVIDELEHILNRLDFFRLVGFGDDDFFVRPKGELVELAQKYKKRIGLPFGVAISSRTYNRKKIEPLLDGGLKIVQMGVQSASQRVLNEVYNRRIDLLQTKQAAQVVGSYHKTYGLKLLLDFIIDNPYETRDDIIQTYMFLLDLPSYVRTNLFFLAFFPGTPIYERALRDGIIQPFNEEAFRPYTRSRVRYQKNYETLLILLLRHLNRGKQLGRSVPRSVLRALGSRPLRHLASLLPRSLYGALGRFIQ